MSKLEARSLPHWKKWPRLLWAKAEELHGLSDFWQRSLPYAPEALRTIHSYHIRPNFQGRVALMSTPGEIYCISWFLEVPSLVLCHCFIAHCENPQDYPTHLKLCVFSMVCKFCHHLCPEKHYPLGGCLKKGAGFVSSAIYCLRWLCMLKGALVDELDFHRPRSFMGFLRSCVPASLKRYFKARWELINSLRFSSLPLEMWVQFQTHSMYVAREPHNGATFQRVVQSKARV